MRAAVPSAKLTGPSSLLTTIVLPGSYVVTVPDAVVVVVLVSVVVAGCVLVVCSVVVVLVCANANGAINAQPSVIMLVFICMLPLFVCFVPDLGDQGRPTAGYNRPFPLFDCFWRVHIRFKSHSGD